MEIASVRSSFEGRQRPVTQLVPDPQVVPQPPQFMLSLCGFTHTPEQKIVPAPQMLLHEEELHVSPAGQTVPHPPQFAGSISVLTQEGPHTVSPVGQVHALAVHPCPVPHPAPQPPQCAGSIIVSTQVPPQSVAPTTQVQVLVSHTIPPVHAALQAPQWSGFMAVSRQTSTPSTLQTIDGAGQAGTQDPPSQSSSAAHALSHTPQCILSRSVSVQAPAQRVSVPTQGTVVQAPALHSSPTSQIVPQVPQFAVSVCVSTQVPSHSVSPGQGSTIQVATMHSSPTSQIAPQEPQFALSVCVSTQAPPHSVSLGRQLPVQVPDTHVSSGPHALPQLPQLEVSFDVLVHPEAHVVSPMAHPGGGPESTPGPESMRGGPESGGDVGSEHPNNRVPIAKIATPVTKLSRVLLITSPSALRIFRVDLVRQYVRRRVRTRRGQIRGAPRGPARRDEASIASSTRGGRSLGEMISDPIVAGALSALGLVVALATARGRRSLWLRISGVGAGAIRAGSGWRAFFVHPCLRLFPLLALLLALGWTATVATVGVEQTSRSFSFGPSPEEVRTCHFMQRTVHDHLRYRDRIGLFELRPGPLPDGFADSCPHHGELLVDDEGYLNCTRHGRRPRLERLVEP